MIALKPGVRAAGVRPELVLAILIATAVWQEDGDNLTITSLADGRHSHTSLHYSGAAVDFRIHGVRDPAGKVRRIKERLGIDYDVLLEADHIHLEYQPRRLS